jgi:peptidoglycan hydrolase-like protein with peptidoglycan-binding domain
MPTIRKGSTGETVKTWQTFLKLRNVDGIFGPETEAATLLFQTRNGLTADGIVGPQTWAAAARQQPPANAGSSAALMPLLAVLGGGALLMMTLGGKKHSARHARR